MSRLTVLQCLSETDLRKKEREIMRMKNKIPELRNLGAWWTDYLITEKRKLYVKLHGETKNSVVGGGKNIEGRVENSIICLTEVPKVYREKRRTEGILGETLTENCWELTKDIKPQIEASKQIPNGINENKSMPRHMIKLWNTKTSH